MDRENLVSNLRELIDGFEPVDAVLFLSVAVVSAVLVFSAFNIGTGQEEDDKVMFSGEINSSENQMVVDFYNESAELIVEQSPEARFYIDLNRDGSADIELGLNHDGTIRKQSKILDYRSGAYLFEFTYNDDANKTEDHWLRPESMKILE